MNGAARESTGDRYDAIVVGGGLAGMMTALELRPLRVGLVSLRNLGEWTSSAWAQGGIAAAVGDDDSPALHAKDTVAAGAGLVERRVAARLAADAPHAIERVASLGVRFDREDAAHYALGREGAHSRRRILRAGGDATGAELVRAIALAVHEARSIVPIENATALDVAMHEGEASSCGSAKARSLRCARAPSCSRRVGLVASIATRPIQRHRAAAVSRLRPAPARGSPISNSCSFIPPHSTCRAIRCHS
jgi:aspartate oxidase